MIQKYGLLELMFVRPILSIVPLMSRICVLLLDFAPDSINVCLVLKAAGSSSPSPYVVDSIQDAWACLKGSLTVPHAV